MRPAAFTTATRPAAPDAALRARPLVPALLAGYAAVWAWAAVAPVDRAEWWLEQLLPAGTLVFLVLAWRKRLLRLSDASYAALALFLALHAAGARYGYEATPAGAWLAERLGTARNPYDRVVHLAFGLLVAYPLREVWLRFGRFTRFARAWASVHAWVLVLAGSAVYEVLEWGAARLFAPGLGSAFVGAQGDVWDAPADMGMAAAGATLGLLAAELAHVAAARRAAARARAAGAGRAAGRSRAGAARVGAARGPAAPGAPVGV
jgi:putative membrane protein